MTKLIPILSGRCLVVELPDGSEFPRIGNGVLKAERTHDDYSVTLVRLPLPPGNWRIIGMLSEVTEEMATTVVKECIDACECTTGYVNYNRGNKPKPFCLDTAIESLESAIEAVGHYLDNNPIPPFHERKDDWMMAQERVLDRSRCLLLGRDE